MLELSFSARLKNSVLLFIRHFGKTLLAAGIALIYAIAVIVAFPGSVFLLLIAGLWLPLLCMLQIIYPVLDETFGIEEAIEQSRKRKNEE